MSPLEAAVLGLYFLTLVILAVFGLHRYVMVYLYYRNERQRARPVPLPERLPRVTVQLPLYNEMYVVERLVDSVTRIRYPKELLEIQVLDDSSDETCAIAQAAVERHRAQGFDIHYIHRDDRRGFKAGALDEGLRAARGEFVLIFDADFVAPPEILESSSSTAGATAPAASSTSTARRASGGARPSSTPAAGSTTRSRRTWTCPTARR